MSCPLGQRETEMVQSHPLVKEAVIALPVFHGHTQICSKSALSWMTSDPQHSQPSWK